MEWLSGLLMLLAYMVAGTPLAAQEPGFAASLSDRVTLSARVGMFVPRANGPLFDLFAEELTLGRADFIGPAVDLEAELHLSERWGIVAGVASSRAEPASQVRGALDGDGSAIRQRTRLQILPMLYAGPTFTFWHSGAPDSIVDFASRSGAYIGLAGGWARYDLRQTGEFLDRDTDQVFSAMFDSAGHAVIGLASVGVILPVHSRIGVTGEARYQLGESQLRGDYDQLGEIDLSGGQLWLGLVFRP